MFSRPSNARMGRGGHGLLAFVAVVLTGLPCLSQSLIFNETAPQFGAVASGKAGEPKTLSISNATGSPVLIKVITTTQDFAQTNNCKIWLAEGSACLIFVTFTPQSEGRRTGKLTVALIGLGEQAISLNGTGVAQQGANGESAPNEIPASIRTTNNEEKAQELLNEKKDYTFQDLLKKNPEGVADAEKVFSLTNDTQTKMRLASILLSLRVKDGTYFDFLAGEARKALAHDHDMPWPLLYDDQKQQKALNPALNDWCKTHGVDFWDMDKVEFYEMPISWYDLAAAGYPPAYDLLVKGLHSQNLAIVAMAAQGLAKLQDPRAIDELIAVGRQVPGEALGGIVQSLIYFEDPKAQAAAQTLLPEKQRNLLDFYRGQKKASGMRALFQW